MWLISLLPDSLISWVVHTILLMGIFGTILEMVLNYIPPLIQYKIAIKYISLLLLVSGIYCEGLKSAELKWRERVKEAEEKVVIAESKSQQTNTVIKEQVVEKIKVVKEQVIVNHNVIKKQKEYINLECKIPDIAFTIYDAAVRNAVHE